MLRSPSLRLLASNLLILWISGVAVAADEQEEALKALQGKWMRRQSSPQGPVVVTKEHRGNQTILTVTDKNQKVLYSHRSEYRIERSERVWIFTFGNRTILAGPDAGKSIDKTSSYIYRVVDDRMIEVRGVMIDDKDPPQMVIWKRVKEGEQKPKK